MHWHDKARSGGVGHCDGLLRCAMRLDPRFVHANSHDRQIDRAVSPNERKVLRHGRVSCKGDDLDLAGAKLQNFSLTPIQLGDLSKSRSPEQIASGARCDQTRFIVETAKRSQVEMIKVSMGKENQVDRWQLVDLKRRGDEP